MIPLTTARLDPRDFGLFAILCSFNPFLTSFATIGSGYLWAAYFPRLEKAERPNFVTTIVSTGFIFVLIGSFLFWFLWPLQEYLNLGLTSETRIYYGMILIGSVIAYPWIHAIDYLTLEGKSGSYAVIIITSTFVSAATTLFCLYYLNLHVSSLFIANVASSLVFGVGSLCVLKTYLRPVYSRDWVKVIFLKGVPTAPGNILQAGAVIVERNILTASLSLSSLGLYTHSQSYYGLVSLGIKALARTIWPLSLKEACEKSKRFPMTRAGWEPLFFLLTVCGLLSGAVGKEAIAVLTHDKFTTAAGFVTCWLIYIAIQNAGKEQMAVLYSNNHGIFLTYLTMICQAIFMGCLFVFIPVFGIWGAFVAAISQQLIYRIFIQIKASKIQHVAFNDGVVLVAIAFISVALGIQMIFWEEMIYRILILSVVLVFYMYVSFDMFKQLLSLSGRKIIGFFHLIRASQS